MKPVCTDVPEHQSDSISNSQAPAASRRLDFGFVLGLCLLVIVWLLKFYQGFGYENEQLSKGVCCGFTDPVFDAVIKMERGEKVDYIKGYAAFLGANWWSMFDRDPHTLMWMSHCAHGLTGFLALVFGFLRNRPWVGLLSSVAILFTPVGLYTSLRWDVYSLQAPVLLAGWMMVYWSRGFTRIVPTVIFVGVVWVSAFWSFRETDNLILMLCLASMAFGSWMRALIHGQDEDGRSVPRLRAGVIAVCACAFVLWQIGIYWRFTSPEGLQYYFREAENPVRGADVELTTVMRWLGYWGHLYWRAFGPYLSTLIGIAFLLWGLTKRISWGLLCGVVIPYMALSWISKRNFYYPSVLWVLLPFIVGEGISGIQRIWIRRMLALIGIAICVGNLTPRLQNQPLVGDDEYGGLFQTSDNDITLQPKKLFGVQQMAHAISTHLPVQSCHEEQIVLMEGNAMIDEVAIRLSRTHPCTQFKRQLQRFGPMATEQSIRIWIRDPERTEIRSEWLEDKGFELREHVLMDNRFELELWVKVSGTALP